MLSKIYLWTLENINGFIYMYYGVMSAMENFKPPVAVMSKFCPVAMQITE